MLDQRPGKRDKLPCLLVQRGKVAAAILVVAAHHIRNPVADLVIGKTVLPCVHGLLVLKDGRNQRVIVCTQAAEMQPLGFHFIML